VPDIKIIFEPDATLGAYEGLLQNLNQMKIQLITLLFFSWSMSSGQVNTETRKVHSFQSIKVGNAVDVRLSKGDREVVRVEAEGLPIDHVVTNSSGGTLNIELDHFKFRTKVKVTVYVTYVVLHRIEAKMAADVLAEQPIKTESLELEANTASSMELAVDADNVVVEAETASNVILSGITRQLKVITETSSNVDASQLKARKVTADASTASGIRLSVSEELTAEANTAGTIRYRGNPSRSNTSSNTAGNIKRID
jgi:hypothetical protein